MNRVFRPPTGWHYIKCIKCGAQTTMTHYGGTKKVKECDWCNDHLCYKCFKEDNEKNQK
jgi:hypothetical protein